MPRNASAMGASMFYSMGASMRYKRNLEFGLSGGDDPHRGATMDKRRLPKHDLREIPTAAEIASRKAEVQSSWDDATERMRRTGTSTHQELQVPVVTVAEIVSGK